MIAAGHTGVNASSRLHRGRGERVEHENELQRAANAALKEKLDAITQGTFGAAQAPTRVQSGAEEN